MARILGFQPNTQRITTHSVDKGVICEHQVISDTDGAKILHLTTLGSKDRESHPKSSQSLQLDTETAAQLVKILHDSFGDDVLGTKVDMDVAPQDGAVTVDIALLAAVYNRNPAIFRQFISDDRAASDVIAMAHRREQVARFRRLLEDDEYFDSEKARFPNRGGEAVWQDLFERNPWIFGVSLSGQLLTSWDSAKLEQVVVGHSVATVGKRTDALLRTVSRIPSMVFAEIKTHRKELLEPVRESYRSGCWAPSFELSGGVVQAQGTVHRAVTHIGERIQATAADGSDIPGEFTYLLRPRSYLIIGSLESLRGEGGGYHQDKIRSFELFRRELVQPEILTFDELLARAEWMVESADVESHPARS
ncbi:MULTISPECIES: Shedu immune nuclease family protein [unclassified Nocardia]|uniref:Shedu immune nuclease family protein n=1 Tax=unclassified Nocardia TaxID=2637762 RepID=UPI00278BB173|nr:MULTISPECIES: Shedu immune nuclease family protein [unclassified Nocardia]